MIAHEKQAKNRFTIILRHSHFQAILISEKIDLRVILLFYNSTKFGEMVEKNFSYCWFKTTYCIVQNRERKLLKF